MKNHTITTRATGYIRTSWLAVSLLIFSVLLFAPSAFGDERDQLRDNFKQRYPVLVQLKQAGKVGEVHTGYIEAVQPAFARERVNPDDSNSPTIAAFITAENRDRQRLYTLLAEEIGATPQAVAQRNARRNFDNAGPEEYLKPRSGQWVQKKNLRDEDRP